MDAESLLHDMASVLLDPEIKKALFFYNLRHNHNVSNSVAQDLLRKREKLHAAYTTYKGQQSRRPRG